jgi:hypothetical protein
MSLRRMFIPLVMIFFLGKSKVGKIEIQCSLEIFSASFQKKDSIPLIKVVLCALSDFDFMD